ncbi:MAG: signal recognition particle-docking protein FtsY [Spiribacter sp.]|jgi:signal recognition particle-docking protein FtsY|nr:signal recognition particle-docking protein FtsY [Spiribacter sp.]MDR9480117.1 signal recognition particle-docking protein FtsY [Spiribacter sp.]
MLPFRRKRSESTPTSAEAEPSAKANSGLLSRLRAGLKRTGSGIGQLFLGRKQIDAELLDDLETLLLTADVGIEATTRIIEDLTARLKRNELTDTEALREALREDMLAILTPVAQPLDTTTTTNPFVILTVGINGAGKTTTIGKLAEQYRHQGHNVLLAAGDTFRAAAVEQLRRWGERTDTAVVSQPTGSDSASVVYDAHQAAIARGNDLLIADTAGRLHTQGNLMEELKKVRRVLGKQDQSAPHEVLLVLDAGTGQNAIAQVEQFQQAVEVTGIALTKLDGTAKGGVIFAIAQRFGIPVRFIGVGEGVDDLRAFDPEAFVDALLEHTASEPSVE